jgi:hypothetical protein
MAHRENANSSLIRAFYYIICTLGLTVCEGGIQDTIHDSCQRTIAKSFIFILISELKAQLARKNCVK